MPNLVRDTVRPNADSDRATLLDNLKIMEQQVASGAPGAAFGKAYAIVLAIINQYGLPTS